MICAASALSRLTELGSKSLGEPDADDMVKKLEVGKEGVTGFRSGVCWQQVVQTV